MKTQIDILADFIMANVEGRPNADDGGAGYCAISIITELKADLSKSKKLAEKYIYEYERFAIENGLHELQVENAKLEAESEGWRELRDKWYRRWEIAYDILDNTQRRQYDEEVDAIKEGDEL